MAVLKATAERAPMAAWARLLLDDRKQVMLSLSENGLVVMKMGLGGLIPIGKIWSCDAFDVAAIDSLDRRQGEKIIDMLTRQVIDCVSILNVIESLDNVLSLAMRQTI